MGFGTPKISRMNDRSSVTILLTFGVQVIQSVTEMPRKSPKPHTLNPKTLNLKP